MPRYGLNENDECLSGPKSDVFFSGADSIQPIRHLNSTREISRLQKVFASENEKRRRSIEAISNDFDSKLAKHRAAFSPKTSACGILERSMNTIMIDPVEAKNPSLYSSSTPLPSSKPQHSFSLPATSILSPIPNSTNSPRFRDSLASPLFYKPTVPTVQSSSNSHISITVPLVEQTPPKSKFGLTVVKEGFEEPKNGIVPVITTQHPPVIHSTVQRSKSVELEWSLSMEYYSGEKDSLKFALDEARIFESRSGITTRSLIKRSIVEKVTVTSKRHATTEEKASTSQFFIDLLQKKSVVGFSNECVQLNDSKTLHYAMSLIIDHYISLLQRDIHLCTTVSSILYMVSLQCPSFSHFLLASLLSRSVFLDMNESKSNMMVDEMISDPDSRSDRLDNEIAISCLFYTLHSLSSKKPMKDAPFPFSSIWRILSHHLNRPSITIATPFTLTQLLQTCGSDLQSRYGRQMEKILSIITDKLLPSLHKELESNDRSRKAGNAMYISSLRNVIDNLLLSSN